MKGINQNRSEEPDTISQHPNVLKVLCTQSFWTRICRTSLSSTPREDYHFHNIFLLQRQQSCQRCVLLLCVTLLSPGSKFQSFSTSSCNTLTHTRTHTLLQSAVATPPTGRVLRLLPLCHSGCVSIESLCDLTTFKYDLVLNQPASLVGLHVYPTMLCMLLLMLPLILGTTLLTGHWYLLTTRQLNTEEAGLVRSRL